MPTTLDTFNLSALAFLLAVLSLAVILLFRKKKSTSRGNDIILVGSPDAGKTSILAALVYEQILPTHTSLQTNASIVNVSKTRALRVVDIPGHPRVRDQFQEHVPNAKAVVFVVDASTMTRNAAVVAEHLHSILHTLTSLPPSQALPSLLILAHKSDLLRTGTSSDSANTQAINRVKTVLERELEKRRLSQIGGVGVEGLGAEGERSEMGGLECVASPGSPFRFADWEGGEVAFIGSSAKTLNQDDEKQIGDDLSDFRQWLAELV